MNTPPFLAVALLLALPCCSSPDPDLLVALALPESLESSEVAIAVIPLELVSLVPHHRKQMEVSSDARSVGFELEPGLHLVIANTSVHRTQYERLVRVVEGESHRIEAQLTDSKWIDWRAVDSDTGSTIKDARLASLRLRSFAPYSSGIKLQSAAEAGLSDWNSLQTIVAPGYEMAAVSLERVRSHAGTTPLEMVMKATDRRNVLRVTLPEGFSDADTRFEQECGGAIAEGILETNELIFEDLAHGPVLVHIENPQVNLELWHVLDSDHHFDLSSSLARRRTSELFSPELLEQLEHVRIQGRGSEVFFESEFNGATLESELWFTEEADLSWETTSGGFGRLSEDFRSVHMARMPQLDVRAIKVHGARSGGTLRVEWRSGPDREWVILQRVPIDANGNASLVVGARGTLIVNPSMEPTSGVMSSVTTQVIELEDEVSLDYVWPEGLVDVVLRFPDSGDLVHWSRHVTLVLSDQGHERFGTVEGTLEPPGIVRLSCVPPGEYWTRLVDELPLNPRRWEADVHVREGVTVQEFEIPRTD